MSGLGGRTGRPSGSCGGGCHRGAMGGRQRQRGSIGGQRPRHRHHCGSRGPLGPRGPGWSEIRARFV